MQFIYGFAVAFVFGILAYLLRLISLSGMIGGAIFGTIIYGCTGWQGFSIPLVFFIIGSLCTKHGYKKKAEMGIAQEEGGKRGAKHALANILAGTIFAVIFFALNIIFPMNNTGNLTVFLLSLSLITAMAGSFATAAADTGSSEIGQVYGKTPINPLTFQKVAPGTEGAISIEGTLFGIFASVIVALTALFTGLFGNTFTPFVEAADLQVAPVATILMAVSVVIGAFLGNVIESLIGVLGGKNINNEVLNFLNTLIGGLISGLIYFAFARYYLFVNLFTGHMDRIA